MRTEEPRAIHLADYKAPEFRIRTVHLDFSLEPEATRVSSRLEIERLRGRVEPRFSMSLPLRQKTRSTSTCGAAAVLPSRPTRNCSPPNRRIFI